MIRHEYNGYGAPPGPPQLPSSLFFPSSSLADPSYSLAAATSAAGGGDRVGVDPAGRPLVPVALPGYARAHPTAGEQEPLQHTTYPYVTGSSVVALKYKDGILMAADTLGSYGRTKRYKSVQRMQQVAPSTVLGAGGEISDYHFVLTLLTELLTDDFTEDDGHVLGPREIHSYLTRVLYNRRSRFDPLWNTLIVAGLDAALPSADAPKRLGLAGGADAAAGDGGKTAAKPFLGVVTMLGVQYEDDHVASGYGAHLARPILRAEHRSDMSEEEAVRLLEKCMRVLVARDSSAINKIQVSKVTPEGVTISEPYAINAKWDYVFFNDPTLDPFSGSW